MKLLNFNITKLTFCICIGIVITRYVNANWLNIIYIILVLMVVLIGIHYIYTKFFKYAFIFNGITYLMFILLGVSTVMLHEQQYWNNHYLQRGFKKDTTCITTFKIQTVLKPNRYQHKYIVTALSLSDKQVTGTILLNIKKDSTTSKLKVDGLYIAKLKLENIQPPLNPYQFDYASYLKRQYIYRQASSNYAEIFLINETPHTLAGYAAAFRNTLIKHLKNYGFKNDTLAVIQSLFLGQRISITKTLYQQYINAGAVHILAISGLHVGIVLGLLNVLLLPLTYFKHGHYFKLFLTLILLWSFALVSGFSASVTRAVTMFSIVSFSMHLKRPSNIFNTLIISAFIILLFKPYYLFDVGFQLSYAAVFAIVWIKPLFDSWWSPRHKVIKFIWNIMAVTLAAQIGVTPMSLFYFHQFPGLFFISNLVIIPFIGLLLLMGFFVLILAFFNILPGLLAKTFKIAIETLNTFVTWVASKEQFLMTDIAFDNTLMVTIYLLLVALIHTLKRFSIKRLYVVLIVVCVLQLTFIIKQQKPPKRHFIIFNKSRYTLLGMHQGNSLRLYHNMSSFTKAKDKTISNYKIANFIKSTHEDSLKDFYYFNNKIIYVVDSIGVYNLKLANPHYVLLRNSPKINLNRLIDSLKPSLLIADASNYVSYVKRWKATCKKRKLPFHYTYEKGAFILD